VQPKSRTLSSQIHNLCIPKYQNSNNIIIWWCKTRAHLEVGIMWVCLAKFSHVNETSTEARLVPEKCQESQEKCQESQEKWQEIQENRQKNKEKSQESHEKCQES
jgi:hypothetical protein